MHGTLPSKNVAPHSEVQLCEIQFSYSCTAQKYLAIITRIFGENGNRWGIPNLRSTIPLCKNIFVIQYVLHSSHLKGFNIDQSMNRKKTLFIIAHPPHMEALFKVSLCIHRSRISFSIPFMYEMEIAKGDIFIGN